MALAPRTSRLALERFGVGLIIEGPRGPLLYLKNRYNLILLDLQMPRMDGFEVMWSLKEIEEDGDVRSW